jgi:hypothetical protein
MKTPKPSYHSLRSRRTNRKSKTRADKHLLDDACMPDLSGPDEMLPGEEVGELIGRTVNEEKYEALLARVRYMNSWKQKGYKFTGTIPQPKDISYYYPNDTV